MANPGTNRRDTIIGLIAFVVIAAVGVAAVYFIFRTVADFLTTAAPQLGSALIGTAGLVFVAVIANFGTKIYEQHQQIQQEQRAKKVEVYEEFMAFWFRLLTSGESKEETDQSDDEEGEEDETSPETQAEIERYLRDFTHKLVAWGSEPLIREYVAFKETIKHDTDTALLHFEKVLLEIRRDIGYKNKKLNRGDLLKVFLDRPGIDALIVAEDQKKEIGSQTADVPDDNRDTSEDEKAP